MLTRRLLICATLVGGCDIVFSVDEVSAPTGHPVEVTGSLHRRMLENDTNDVPQLSGFLPPTMVVADVVFADGTEQQLAFGADGEFAFTWPDDSEPYSLTIRSPLTDIITYQLTSPNPRLLERVVGRGNRVPVSPNTFIHATLPADPLPGPGTYLEIESTGIWTRKYLGAIDQPYDWSTTGALGGPTGLLEAGPDAMVLLELQQNASSYQLTRYGIQHQPALVNAQNNAMPFDLVAPVPDQCVSITVDHAAETQRLLAFDATGANVGWYVFTAPVPEYLPEVGFPLSLRNLAAMPSPYSENFMFENPLDGFGSFALFEVGTLGVAGVRSIVAVPLDGTCTPVSLPTSYVKIPSQITVAGTELTTAGQSVAIDRSKLVPIGFTPTEAGAADFYITIVRDATPAGVLRARIVSTEPRAMIDPDLLLPGRSYVVTINSRVGYPNTATGDFETVDTIFASGTAISTTFQVQ